MTEEEKKAIKDLKDMIYETRCDINMFDIDGEYCEECENIKEQEETFTIILNLIEKQQKALQDSIPKEAIREKIKEILKYKEIAENEIEEKIIIADSDSLNFGRKQAHGKDVEILKEILGE